MSLFPLEEVFVYQLPNADLLWKPNFIEESEANTLFQQLYETTPWQADKITVYGKEYDQPRLTCLYGNEGKSYQYSNIWMHPHPWNPLMFYLREKVEEFCQHSFTTVLCNLYRDGNDSNGWHADNEKTLGVNPVIASLSFGATRSFHLKHNQLPDVKKTFELSNGSLLVMKGETQHFWKHAIPKTKKEVGPRINLTFRTLV